MLHFVQTMYASHNDVVQEAQIKGRPRRAPKNLFDFSGNPNATLRHAPKNSSIFRETTMRRYRRAPKNLFDFSGNHNATLRST